MKNFEVAKLLNTIADLLELQEIPWKPQAYRKAALAIESLAEDIADIAKRKELENIPGVGKNIAQKIEEFLGIGKLAYLERLQKEIKINVEELSKVPFLGPKKMKLLYQHLRITNLADLEKAIRQKKIRELPGFGEETEKKLREGIAFVKTKPHRFLYARVVSTVKAIKDALQQLKEVQQIEVAGSFRRGKETVGDIDFLVISSQPATVMNRFVQLPDVQEVLAQGTTKSSIRLSDGLQVDLRVVQEGEFGSAMNYFIGSKEHNIELRKLALSKGYTLSEYGLFDLKTKKKVAGKTEKEIYRKLGMSWIPPELRENLGEIAAAREGKLPQLVEEKDLKGVFHNHTEWSDGNASLLQMAQEAERLGFQFISFNDHAGPMGITNPLTEKRLSGYLREIEQVQKKVSLRVFSGVEVDILKDGSLALPLSALKKVDIVIASVHLATQMNEPEMTLRIKKALRHPAIHILGHPTDRLLNERPSLSANWDAVYSTAQEEKVFLEINASPSRMDLDGLQVHAAKKKGCQFALSTDAHDVSHLSGYRYGILSARRGWAEKKDVLNCWPLTKIEKALNK